MLGDVAPETVTGFFETPSFVMRINKRINATIQRAERVDATSCDHLVFSYTLQF